MELLYLYFLLAVLVAIMAAIRGRPAWLWFLIAVFTTPLIGGLVVMALPRLANAPVADGPQRDMYTPMPQSVPMPCDSTVRIIRPRSLTDRFRPYRIFVNGALVGFVHRDSVVDFHVPCGRLVVEARIDWGRSQSVAIETKPGGQIDLEVRNRWGPVFAIAAMVGRPGRYLSLRQVSAAPEGGAPRAQPVPLPAPAAASGRRPAA